MFNKNNNERNKFYVHIVFMSGIILYSTEIIPQIAFYIICGLSLGFRVYLHFLSRRVEAKDSTIKIKSDEEE